MSCKQSNPALLYGTGCATWYECIVSVDPMQTGLDNILAVFSEPILARGTRIQGTRQIGVILYAKGSRDGAPVAQYRRSA